MTTLDEAIKRAEEVRDEKMEEACNLYEAKNYEASKDCIWCAEEQSQLAEWLKDYKRLLGKNERAEEWYRLFVEKLEQESKMGWTPVSEGLPEEGKTVIASTEYGVYPETRYTKEDGWEWAYEAGADYWRPLECVQAWTPLPKRYEPKESGEDN